MYNHTTFKCFVSFFMTSKSPSLTNTFILRKVMENLCDTAYQKYCRVVVSKEVCFKLHDPTPLMSFLAMMAQRITSTVFFSSNDTTEGGGRSCSSMVKVPGYVPPTRVYFSVLLV